MRDLGADRDCMTPPPRGAGCTASLVVTALAASLVVGNAQPVTASASSTLHDRVQPATQGRSTSGVFTGAPCVVWAVGEVLGGLLGDAAAP